MIVAAKPEQSCVMQCDSFEQGIYMGGHNNKLHERSTHRVQSKTYKHSTNYDLCQLVYCFACSVLSSHSRGADVQY